MLARSPSSLETFVAWLRTKPAGEEYDWPSWSDCACTQYALAMGTVSVDFVLAPHSPVPSRNLDVGFEDVIEKLAAVRPWTFGALRERAERALRTPAS